MTDDTTLTIGVDIGGTKIAAGVVDASGRLLAEARRPTPADSALIARVSADVVAELRAGHEVAAVGVGAAALIDAARSTVLFAPNIAWRNQPLRDQLEQLTGLPVVIENDANAAAWGEYKFGAAQGTSNCVVLTVGTGVGGGVILDGRLVRGGYGIAGELGHIVVRPGGRRCGCGQRGCLERYGSGRALVHEAREFARYSPLEAKRLLELGGGRPEMITGPHVTQAALEGDPAAVECFQILGTWLGMGMADLAAVLDPEVFVLAGGVSDAGDLLRVPATQSFEQYLTGARFRPVAQVRLASKGGEAGMVGAADLARLR